MKPTCLLPFCSLLFFACEKKIDQEQDERNKPVTSKTVYFKELGTKIPISRAWAEPFTCIGPIYMGSCNLLSMGRAYADTNGVCKYSYTKFVDHFSVGHDKYWTPQIDSWSGTGVPIPSEGEIFLAPKSPIAITVSKKNSRPQDRLAVSIIDSARIFSLFGFDQYYDIKSDTILHAYGYGNTKTFVKWNVNNKESVVSFTPHRFDTTKISINID